MDILMNYNLQYPELLPVTEKLCKLKPGNKMLQMEGKIKTNTIIFYIYFIVTVQSVLRGTNQSCIM